MHLWMAAAAAAAQSSAKSTIHESSSSFCTQKQKKEEEEGKRRKCSGFDPLLLTCVRWSSYIRSRCNCCCQFFVCVNSFFQTAVHEIIKLLVASYLQANSIIARLLQCCNIIAQNSAKKKGIFCLSFSSKNKMQTKNKRKRWRARALHRQTPSVIMRHLRVFIIRLHHLHQRRFYLSRCCFLFLLFLHTQHPSTGRIKRTVSNSFTT